MSLIDIPEHNGPLCPQSWGDPTHPAHQLKVRLQDSACKATPRDGDGEPVTPELAKVNAALDGGQNSDWMRLYHELVGYFDGRRNVVVESFYFRCGTCGLILPANRYEP